MSISRNVDRNKLCCTHTIKYHLAAKSIKLLIRRVSHKDFMLSERSWTQKSTCTMIPFICNSGKRMLMYSVRKQISVGLGLGHRVGIDWEGTRGSFGVVEIFNI